MSEKLNKGQRMQLEVLCEVYHAKIAIVAACYNSDIVNQLVRQVAYRVPEEQEKIKEDARRLNGGKWVDNSELDSERWKSFDASPREGEDTLCVHASEVGEGNPIDFAQRRGKFSWKLSKGLSVCYVPGIFEIPQAARLLASRGACDAIIALGCAIKGETAHFDAIAQACTDGLNRVAQDFTMPVAHGVLLVESKEQAEARVDGKKDRGGEAASAVIQMLRLAAEVDININIAMRESE